MARVLVIDDSEVMRSLLLEFLSEQGHQVEACHDGQSGIDRALVGDFDLCICDVHMPKKDGGQVFAEVSAKHPQIRFIFTDSMPDEASENLTISHHQNYLRKPFELDELLELVNSVTRSVAES